jgi:hypothetical protein
MKKLLDAVAGNLLACFYLLGLAVFGAYIGFAFGFTLWHLFGGGS